MTQQTEGGVPAETEDEVSRLMMAWRQEVSGKGTRRLRKLLLIPPILLCACFATVYISTKAGLLILCCAFPIGLLILALLDTEPRDSRRLTPAQRQILADMASLEDLHAIDVLIQKLGQMPQGTVIYRAATDTLTRLLSHLKTEEATCIILHRSALYARLNAYTATQFPDLVIALLRILPSFPDREALSRTAYLIAHDAPTHAQQQVRNAARVWFHGSPAGRRFRVARRGESEILDS